MRCHVDTITYGQEDIGTARLAEWYMGNGRSQILPFEPMCMNPPLSCAVIVLTLRSLFRGFILALRRNASRVLR
jgi:hypothetical protein